LCAKTLQEQKSQNPLKDSGFPKLRRSSIFDNCSVGETQVEELTGKETKVEAFEHLELFQVREESAKAQEEHNYLSDSAEEIWTIEDFTSREQWKSTQSRRDSEPLDLTQNSRQSLDLSRGARGLNPRKQSESPEGVSYRDFGIREFGSPEDESPGTRHQKSQKGKLDLSHPSAEDACHEITISGIRASRVIEGSLSTSRVERSHEEIRTIHLRRTGGRSRDRRSVEGVQDCRIS
jgi:hypothetical protein